MAGPRVGVLDSLRLLAATLVFVQHVAEGRGGWIDRVIIPFEPGVAGVALFFFISGYAIALANPAGVHAPSFLLRRLLRIYPLYLAVLAVLLVLGPAGVLPKWSFMADAGPLPWLANLALVQDFVGVRAFLGVSWTLIIELGFYALFAAALAIPRGVDRLMWLAPAGLLAVALLSLVLDVRIPLGRPLMVVAALLGWQLQRRDCGDVAPPAWRRHLLVSIAAGGVALLIGFGRFQHERLGLMAVVVPWAAATVLFLVAMLWLRRLPLLSQGLLPRLGVGSYAVYLLHPLAIEAATVHLPGIRTLAAVLLTGAAAAIGHRCIERPGMALGRRFARPVAQPA